MSKRGALEQGTKETGLDSGRGDAGADPVKAASADVMARRKIGVPRSRRRPGQGPGVESLGNIFGSGSTSSFTSSTPQTNAFNNINPNVMSNPTQNASDNTPKPQSTFANIFSGTSQPATGGTLFGSNGNSGFGFSAGGAANNPFSQIQPSQAQNNSSLFNTPPLNTPFKGFGETSKPLAQADASPTPSFGFTFGANNQAANTSSSSQSTTFGSSKPGEAPTTPSKQTTNAGSQQQTSPGDSMMMSPPQGTSASQPSQNSDAAKSGTPQTANNNIFASTSKEPSGLFTKQPATTASLFSPKPADSSNLFSAKSNGAPDQPASTLPQSSGAFTASANMFAPAQEASPQSNTPNHSTTSNPFANVMGARSTSTVSNPGPKASLFPTTASSAQPTATSTSSPFHATPQWTSKTPQPTNATTAPSNLFQPATAPPKTSSNLFAPPPPLSQNFPFPTTMGTPGAGLLGQQPAKDPQSTPLFQAAGTPSQALSQAQPASGESAMQSMLDQWVSPYNLSEAQTAGFKDHAKLRSLNREFLNLVNGLSNSDDLPSLVQAYMSEHAKLPHLSTSESVKIHKRKADPPANSSPAKAARTDELPSTPLGSSLASSKPQSQTANMFQSIIEERDSSPSRAPSFGAESSNLPPQSAKPLFGTLTPQPHSSEPFGHARQDAPNTVPPKFGDGPPAWNSSLFKKTDTANSAGGIFGSAAQNSFGRATHVVEANLSATAGSNAQPQAQAQAAFVKDAPTSSIKIPSFGASTAGPTNFAAQFGQQAKKTADSEKAKRKADDFDSDEDDEAEWERQDAEKQRKKAAELGQPANKKMKFVPGKGFVLEEDNSGTSERSTDRDSSPAVSDASSHSAATPGNIFQNVAPPTEQDDDDDSDEDNETIESAMKQPPAEPSSGRSLFDRISMPGKTNGEGAGDGSKTRPISLDGPSDGNNIAKNPFGFAQTAGPVSGSLFGKSTASPESKATGVNTSPGDHTWKGDSDSPIKFGSSSTAVNGTPTKDPRPFAALSNAPRHGVSTPNLFGNLATSSSPGWPSKTGDQPGSLFGSKTGAPSGSTPLFSASGATTPGTTSNGTSANPSDDEGAAPDAQSDLTALSAEERTTEDVLFEIKSKLMQYNKEDKANPFKTIGTGPLRILQNKESKSVRVLCRCAPRGQVILNATLQKGMLCTKKQKCVVQFGAPDPAGNFQTWYAKVGQDDKADELLKKLQEHTSAA